MTPDALITELDSLADRCRRVARMMVAPPTLPTGKPLDRAIELYRMSAQIEEWIAALVGEAK